MDFNFIIMSANAWPIVILFLLFYIGYKFINRKSNYSDLIKPNEDEDENVSFATKVIAKLLKRKAMKNKIGDILTERWENQTRFGNKIIRTYFNKITFLIYMLIVIAYYSSLSIIIPILTINIPATGVIIIFAGGIVWAIMKSINDTGYVYNITNYNYKWFWKIKKYQIDVTDILIGDNKSNEVNEYLSELPKYNWDLLFHSHTDYDIYNIRIIFRYQKDIIAFKLSIM